MKCHYHSRFILKNFLNIKGDKTWFWIYNNEGETRKTNEEKVCFIKDLYPLQIEKEFQSKEIEGRFAPIARKLNYNSTKEFKSLSPDEKDCIIRFVVMQIVRQPCFKQELLNTYKEKTLNDYFQKNMNLYHHIDIVSLKNELTNNIGVNLNENPFNNVELFYTILYYTHFQKILFENNFIYRNILLLFSKGCQFITSDFGLAFEPSILTDLNNQRIHNSSIYFPISPRVCLFISNDIDLNSDKKCLTHKILKDDEISKINGKLAFYADKTIISKSEIFNIQTDRMFKLDIKII